jgi:hypothetical protein
MGVEPTAARSVRPATDFEDRGAHRDPTTPQATVAYPDSSFPSSCGLNRTTVFLCKPGVGGAP